MKRILKRVCAVFLCVCLIFFASYRKPVKAEAAATALVVGGSVLVMGALTALGIGCANGYNNHEWNQKCQSIWNGMSEAVRDSVSYVAGGPSQTEVVAKYADKFMESTYQGFVAEFPPGTSLGSFASNDAFVTSMKWTSTYKPASYAGAVPWGNNLAISDLQNISLVKTYTKSDFPFKRNGIELSVSDSNYNGVFVINASLTDAWSKAFKNTVTFMPFQNGSFYPSDIQLAELTAYDSATKCDVWLLLDNYGCVGYEGFKDATTTVPDKTQIPTDQPVVPGDKNIYAQGHSVLNNSYDDVMAKIKAAQGTLDSINLKISDAVGNLSEINDQVRTQTQAQEVGQSIADTATDAVANEAVNAGRDISMPHPNLPNLNMPSAFIKKFPFCLPWDIYSCVQMFTAAPVTPKFQIPFYKGKAFGQNVDWEITIDVGQFDKDGNIGNICRWFSRLLTVVGLIFLTKKLIWK